MTNIVETVIVDIISRLEGIGITAVYRYPDQIPSIGNNYPLALIKEGNKTFEETSGQLYMYSMPLSITLVSDQIQNRTYYMNNLEVACFNALFRDSRLGGLVDLIEPIEVLVGDLVQGDSVSTEAGYTETTNFRTIRMNLQIRDTRTP